MTSMPQTDLILPRLPVNLEGLAGEEERIRTDSWLEINASEKLREHLDIIHEDEWPEKSPNFLKS